MFVLEIKDIQGVWHKVKGSSNIEELKAEACGESSSVRIREIVFDYEDDPDNYIDRRAK